MTRNSRIRVAAVVLSLAAIITGLHLYYRAFRGLTGETVDEHRAHLLDIARSTDRNITTVIERTRDELGHAAEENGETEALYLSGNTAAMEEALSAFHFYRDGYASFVLLLREDNVL